MNELARHIEYLLLHNDCIIVPHFGAFIASVSSARQIADEELYLPSVRVVRFNSELQTDATNQFVDSLCQLYGLSADEADQKCVDFATEFNDQLASDGNVDFGSLGVFSLEDGVVTLSACEAGITSPDYYGLDAFNLKPLQDAPQPLVMPLASTEQSKQQDDSHIVLRINRKFVNATVTAVASIIMFLLFNVTAENTTTVSGSQQYSAELFIPITTQETHHSEVPSTSMATPASQVATSVAATEAKPAPVDSAKVQTDSNEAETPKVEAPCIEQEQPARPYCIVLACKVSKQHAMDYSLEMQKKGYNCTIVYKKGSPYVVIPDFATKDEARKKLKDLVNQGVVEGAWVMKNQD